MEYIVSTAIINIISIALLVIICFTYNLEDFTVFLTAPVHLNVAVQSLLFLLAVPPDLEYLGPGPVCPDAILSPVRVLSALPP